MSLKKPKAKYFVRPKLSHHVQTRRQTLRSQHMFFSQNENHSTEKYVSVLRDEAYQKL